MFAVDTHCPLLPGRRPLPHYCFLIIYCKRNIRKSMFVTSHCAFRVRHRTRSQINDTFLFQSRVKVKVLGEHFEIGITSKTVGPRPP